jgi:hypothetical protein
MADDGTMEKEKDRIMGDRIILEGMERLPGSQEMGVRR